MCLKIKELIFLIVSIRLLITCVDLPPTHSLKILWNSKMTLSNFLRQQNQCTPLPRNLICVELLGRINAEDLSDANR